MSDFRLKVIAETQAAESSLKQVDKVANEATRARNLKIEIPNYSDLSKNFRDLNKDIGSAANGIKDFYKVASKLPVGPINDINELAGQLKRVAVTATDTGRNVGDAGDVIKSTFNATNKAAESLVSRLTKIALGLYVIKEAAGLVQGAFGGMFNETIGREIKLRETILKTQTTLASTNKVFKDGKEITDPYQKIVTLTGAVRKNIDSIRERSIALAGVTSGEVIEVFGIVASQIGQIGGGLKEAEDLAITFAAALGTFGIPLYQARQEIGSILRGDITVDSYLARAIGITNEDIAKAKTETGGVVKFLEERLAAAVAGQRIAAEGFSGVVSNIKDLSELVSQNFGAGLLDPLLDSLTKVFDFLFSIRNEMFAIAKLAGESIGTVADTALKLVGGATGGARQTRLEGGGGGGRTGGGTPLTSKVTSDFGADDALNAAKATVNYVKLEVSKAFSTVFLQISTLLERVSSAFLAVGGGLAMLAKGLLSIKLETFKALIGAIESISPALLVAAKGLGAFLGLWGKFMELPLVQELAQISAGMKVLEMTGVTPLIMTGGTLVMLFKNWSKVIEFVVTQFNSLRTIIGGVIAYIGGLIAQLARAATAMLTAWSPSLKALQGLRTELLGVTTQLNNIAVAAQRAGTALNGAQQKVEGLKGGMIGLIAGFIKFQLIMFAITAAVSLAMERFSAYKEAQDKIASDKRVQEAIRRLATTYKDLGENATESQKRAKAFEQSLVNQDYDKAIENIEKLKKKIEELRNTFQKPTGFNATLVGKEINNLLASLNPDNFDISGWDATKPLGQQSGNFGDAIIEKQIKRLEALQIEGNKKAREVDKIAGEQNVVLEAQKRVDLSKEYAELQRQQQSDLFQQRQTLAQKEVEIFRAAGELRIFQMEQANAKLIEGEEGASRTALEALNTYLSVRENGELEIEAAKKDIVIEVANLEKTIADYRFENEKKIAEIRKRAGENEKAMADARRQAEQTPMGPPVTEGEVGRTGGGQAGPTRGRSTGPHLHAQSAGMSEKELRAFIDAALVFPNGGKASQFGSSRGYTSEHGGVDFLTPQNTPYSLAPGYSARSMGVQGNLGLGQEITGPGGKRAQLGHLASASGGAVPARAPAAATPALQSLDVLAPAADAYAAAVRGLASALERARALQAALTDAKTAAAFTEIAKAAFPQVALEQYEDQLVEARGSLDALAKSSGEAYDPERLRIAVELQSRLTIQERELDQIRADARKKLKPEELKKLEEDLTKRKTEFVAQLKKEKELREQLLPLVRAQAAVEGLRRDTAAVPFELQRAGAQAAGAMAGAYGNQDDPARARMIEAEIRIAERRIQLEQDLSKGTEEVRRELAEYANAQRAAAQTLGELDQSVADFINVVGTIREVSKTMTEGFKGFFKEVLSGGDIEDAMNSMLQNITDKFLTMALDAAFRPMEQLFTEQLKNIFGIEDPAQKFQEENTAALAAVTTAQEAASSTQQRAADTQLRAAELQLQAAASGATPGAPLPMSQQVDSTMGPNGQPVPLNQAANNIVRLSVEPFNAAADNATSTLNALATQAAEGVAAMPNFTESVTSFSDAASTTEQNLRTAGSVTSQLTERFGGLMKAAGSAMAVLGGLAMGYAGAQQMQKGGIYNTLMGLAGVFGAISSVAGGISSIGGMFGGGGGGGGGGAAPGLPSWNDSFNYVPSFAGGGYTGAGAMAGGLDGKGGFMAMLHPNETVVPGSPYAATASALDGGSGSGAGRFSNEPIKLETRVINGVEYATIDQLQQATRQAETRGAERGRALALGSMRNSVKTRKQVGLA